MLISFGIRMSLKLSILNYQTNTMKSRNNTYLILGPKSLDDSLYIRKLWMKSCHIRASSDNSLRHI